MPESGSVTNVLTLPERLWQRIHQVRRRVYPRRRPFLVGIHERHPRALEGLSLGTAGTRCPRVTACPGAARVVDTQRPRCYLCWAGPEFPL